MIERRWKSAAPDARQQAFDERTRDGVSYIDASVPQFRPQDGENCVRLVPPLDGDSLGDQWGFNVWVHFINGYFVCPRSFDRSAICGICAGALQMRREDPDLAKQMTGALRTLIWILDCNRAAAGELKIWPAPTTLINSFLKLGRNRRTGELISIEDPEVGRAIFFEKTGTGLQTRYDSIALDEVAFPLDAGLLAELKYFEEVLILNTTEEIEAGVQAFLASEGAAAGDGSTPGGTAAGTASRVRQGQSQPDGWVATGQPRGVPEDNVPIDSPAPIQGGRVRPGAAPQAQAAEGRFNRSAKPSETAQEKDDQQILQDVQERIKQRLAGMNQT